MRLRAFTDFTPLRVALAALGIAALFTVWALVSAFHTQPLPVPASAVTGRIAALPNLAKAPAADIDSAVDEDVFSPDRTPPDEPFHMPGEALPSAVAAAAPLKPTVLGTAVGPNGLSFATAQLGDAQSRIVRIGDKVGSYTVMTIARGHVVFATPRGDQLDIAAQTASTQETTHDASLDTVATPFFPRNRGGGAFFGNGAGGTGGFRGRGRRGATADSSAFRQ